MNLCIFLHFSSRKLSITSFQTFRTNNVKLFKTFSDNWEHGFQILGLKVTHSDRNFRSYIIFSSCLDMQCESKCESFTIDYTARSNATAFETKILICKRTSQKRINEKPRWTACLSDGWCNEMRSGIVCFSFRNKNSSQRSSRIFTVHINLKPNPTRRRILYAYSYRRLNVPICAKPQQPAGKHQNATTRIKTSITTFQHSAKRWAV